MKCDWAHRTEPAASRMVSEDKPFTSNEIRAMMRATSMKFAAIIEYAPDPQKIARVRPVHREYIQALKKSGHIAITGPFLDDSGGLLVYEAETKEEAEKLIREDPFFKEGVFVSWVLRAWNPVAANPALLPNS